MRPVEYHEATEEELLNEIGYLELRATERNEALTGLVGMGMNCYDPDS